jgi:hypothetical protein
MGIARAAHDELYICTQKMRLREHDRHAVSPNRRIRAADRSDRFDQYVPHTDTVGAAVQFFHHLFSLSVR